MQENCIKRVARELHQRTHTKINGIVCQRGTDKFHEE